MCGVCLILNKKGQPIDDILIRNMNNKAAHRGPDDEGYYHGSHFAFGHRRLCILDLTQAGHQPMNRDNYCLNYNGEIYNYLELIEELKGLGHIFKSHADTEVIVPAYWEWGVEAFNRFNGMWAFMVYDAANHELLLCRDRFGVKPLYYTTVGDFFLAASEIKQFTTFPGFEPVLNLSTAVNFLAHGWLNYSGETFFEGVHELKPGHYLKYNLSTNEMKIEQWYRLRPAPLEKKQGFGEATQTVNNLLEDAVKLRMRADVQVGSCLSGGIDSSSIVSLIQQHNLANDQFKTVTSCYEDKQYDEQDYSDAVTAQTGFTSVKTFPDLDDLLDKDLLDHMIYHHDQPFGSASHFSEYSVFKTARENGIIVLLDGQGSDEYFGGYDDFFTTYIRSLLSRGKWVKARDAVRVRASRSDISVKAQWKIFWTSVLWHPMVNVFRGISGRSSRPWLSPRMRRQSRRLRFTSQAANIRSLSLRQIQFTSIPYQLHSADRNSMAFSLEVREPFMDYRLIEYALALPDEFKISEGYSKFILREAVKGLPDEVRFRNHKMGFVAPDEPWMRKNKERIAAELRDAIDKTGLFSEELLHRFNRFIQGQLGFEPIYFRALAMNRFLTIFNIRLPE